MPEGGGSGGGSGGCAERGGAEFERRFFRRSAGVVAPELLGARLVRVLEDGTRIGGEIVEVEAYLGAKDRAAHTFGGRRTARVEAMYGPAGFAYVYFTYGMHFCMNVVCGEGEDERGGGVGEAVLLRALRPLENEKEMRRRRGGRRADGGEGLRTKELCSGPARLCQALGVDRAFNGVDLLAGGGLRLEPGRVIERREIGRAARVGVAYAGEWAEKPLRWFVRGDENVSVKPRGTI